MGIWKRITDKRQTGQKQLAVLIDPDRFHLSENLIKNLQKMDLILLGSSALIENTVESVCKKLKSVVDTPIVLFPGSELQICTEADAILFLSLISGRNPEYLIGKQVLSAPLIQQSRLETIPTGYMLFDGGHITAAQYVTQSIPLPHNKPDLAVATALAGTMMGMSCIYMDAGSGAKQRIDLSVVQAVKSHVNPFLMVGGGFKSPEAIQNAWDAGADMVIIGTIVEENPGFLDELFK